MTVVFKMGYIQYAMLYVACVYEWCECLCVFLWASLHTWSQLETVTLQLNTGLHLCDVYVCVSVSVCVCVCVWDGEVECECMCDFFVTPELISNKYTKAIN